MPFDISQMNQSPNVAYNGVTIAGRFDQSFVPLSIDELIMQCQNTMQGLDTSLRAKMNDQKARNGTLSALGELSNLINAAPKGEGDTVKVANNAKLTQPDANGKSINDKLDDLARSHPELKELIDTVKAKMADGLTDAEVKECTGLIDTKSDSFRSDNETSMLEIQSITSKRAQALQMTSNLINSMNESAKGAIQNIR